MKTKRVSESEMIVMELMWERKRPMSLGEIHMELERSKGWKYTTVSTFITRLCSKKYLSGQKISGAYVYFSEVTRQQYLTEQTKSFLQAFHNGSVQSLVLSLYDNEAELVQLKQLLNDLEE